MRTLQPDYAENLYAIVGITIAICGNILINVALNIQRYAHRKLENINETNYLKSQLWWTGLARVVTFLAYGFAPASVVSPLGVFALVSNCIIAPCFFGETIRPKNVVGVVVAIIGVVLIILSVQSEGGGKPLPIHDPYSMIKAAICQPAFQIYSAVTACIIVLFMFASARHNRAEMVSLFVNIGLVALLGAYTALSTKCLSSLLSFTLLESFMHPITYALILVIGVTAVLQVVFLNRALQNFSATVVVPLHFVFFTISVITGSGIAFHDFRNKDIGHLIMFFVGCAVTFIGVWLIAASRPAPEESHPSVLVSSPARPILNPMSTTRSLSTTGALSSRALLEDVREWYDEVPIRRGSTASQNLVSSMPLTSSGFFIGTVLESRRSMNALKRDYQAI